LNKKLEMEEKLRINSPRKRPEDDVPKNATAGKGSILVKLPDNIEEQMNRHRNDRQRMREAMLGFPAIFPTNSVENTDSQKNDDDDDEDAEDDEDEDDVRRPTFATEKTSTRRTNSHPQRTRQNGGEARQTDPEIGVEQIISTTSLTTKPATTTPRISTSGLDETPWDIPTKNADKNVDKTDDGFSKKEPTSSRSVWSIAWEAHVYFSGTLFVLLAIYCSVNILRLHTFSRLATIYGPFPLKWRHNTQRNDFKHSYTALQ
jgi:hypothetical protein